MLIHLAAVIGGAIVGLVAGTALLYLVWEGLVVHMIPLTSRPDEDDVGKAALALGQLLGVNGGVALARWPIALDAHLFGACACGVVAGTVDAVLLRRASGAYEQTAALLVGSAAASVAAAVVSLIA